MRLGGPAQCGGKRLREFGAPVVEIWEPTVLICVRACKSWFPDSGFLRTDGRCGGKTPAITVSSSGAEFFDTGGQGLHDAAAVLLDDGRGDGFLGVEVIVERTFADAGPFQHVGQTRLAVAQFAEQIDS